MKKIQIVFIVLIMLVAKNSIALSVGTHEAINNYVVGNSVSYLDTTLKNYGLLNGVNTMLNGKSIGDCIREGGSLEDNAPSLRYLNHFHNPLKSWDSSGLSGITGLSGFFVGYNNSAPIWAQRKNINYNSWPAARDYLYLALTASDENSRNINFINCFDSVGMLMHLIQDMSVPAHVRNDSHPLGNIYEAWVDNERLHYYNEFYQYISGYAFAPDPSLFKTGYNPYATTPISGLFDADLYNGTNPDVTAGPYVGMSEYTNANFLSENTIFSGFTYPSKSSITVTYLEIPYSNQLLPDVHSVIRPYYVKIKDGDNSAYCLATVGYLRDYVVDKILKLHNNDAPIQWFDQQFRDSVISKLNEEGGLDDYCYADYAMRLLPRAAGYSSALLQYFFRGQIDAVDAATTKDGSGDITGMTLKVKNNTPGEEMTANGSSHLVVAYNYKDSGGNIVYGKSADVPLTLFTGSIPSGNETTDDTYKYTFNFSSPIPPDATDPHYMLVYRGKLGQEDDAVAGKGFQGGPIILEDNFGYNWAEPDDSIYSHPAGPYKGIQSFYCNLYQLYGWWGSPRPAAYYEPIRVGWITGYALPKVGDKYLLTGIRPTGVLKSFSISLDDFSSKTAPAPGQYSWELIARIYKNNGSFPGELVAVSLPSYYTGYDWQTGSPTGGWGGNMFVLENPLYIPKDATYNIEVEVLSKGDIFSWLTINWVDTGGIPSYISEAGGDYIQQNGSMICDFNFDPSLNPIASRIYDKPIPFPTDGKIKFWVNSKIAGNVIDFIWGKEGPDYSQPVTINQAGAWEEHEVDVSATSRADRNQLRFIGFSRGKDAYSSSPPLGYSGGYWNIPNQIYFDHIFE